MISRLYLVIFGAIMMALGTITYLHNRQRISVLPAETRAKAEAAARNVLVFTLLTGSLALITAAAMRAMGVRALFPGTQQDFNTIVGSIMIGCGVLVFGLGSWRQWQIRRPSQLTDGALSEQDTKRIEVLEKLKYRMLVIFTFWGVVMLL